MGHLITSVAPLLLQGGGLGRFINPSAQFLTDIINLEPALLQLVAFGPLLGGVYALTALGLTMILSAMDVINSAHGIFLVIGMYSMWLVSEMVGISPFLSIPIAAAVPFALGVVVHILMVEPIIGAPQQNQLIATLGVLFITQSAIGIMFTPDPQQVELLLGSVQADDVLILLGQLHTLVIALGVMLAARAFLSRTDLGRKIRGTADNRDGARYVDTNVRRINYSTFGIGAALVGVAGDSIVSSQRFDPFTGETYLINAFVTVILDGFGSSPGTFVGGLIVGVIRVFGGYYLPGTTAQVLVFLLFIGTPLVKSEGLFGGAEA